MFIFPNLLHSCAFFFEYYTMKSHIVIE
ncbi:putative MH2 domain protein [Trichinella spiralis]|nr:putative MH2 domain protein [Trichinella spiralis]